MATYTLQNLNNAGLTATYAAVASSDKFKNDGNVVLHVKNGGASPLTVTVVSANTISGLTIEDKTYTIAAGADKFIAALNPTIYNDAQGYVTVNYDLTTSVTAAVIQLPN